MNVIKARTVLHNLNLGLNSVISDKSLVILNDDMNFMYFTEFCAVYFILYR